MTSFTQMHNDHLDPDKHNFQDCDDSELPEFSTDPYGKLEFAIGSGDDFVCFDYQIEGNFIKLDSVINSETGSFIDSAGFDILPIETERQKIEACILAMNYADKAFTDVPHSVRGWDQDEKYFARCVFFDLFPELKNKSFSLRQYRKGGKRIDAVINKKLFNKEKW